MDFSVRHLAPFPRAFPSDLRVLNIGDILAKDHWVGRTFSTCNFSFILRGRGEFERKGRTWKIEAPCVITQWPGERPNYGPLPVESTWDEVYFIYDARTVPQLRKRGFLAENRPVWSMENPEGVFALLEELRALIGLPENRTEGAADRIDRICERMILESLMPSPTRRASGDGEDLAAARIETLVRARPEEEYDFDSLAEEHGISPSTFRRQWRTLFTDSPAQHVQNLRLGKARRLLIESDARVGEIAALVGFADVLYFSRRFRLATGLSASEYRKRFRLKPLVIPASAAKRR